MATRYPRPPKEKRRRGDRKDAALIRNIDGLHFIMPIIFPRRTANEAFVSEIIDLTNINAFLEKKNESNPAYKYNLFQVIVSAILRTITLRPKMNCFIKNYSLFQRHDISASFVIKKQFSDQGEEGMAVVHAEDTDTIDTIHDYLYQEITACRGERGDASSDAMDMFNRMPRFLGRSIVNFLRFLDEHGWVPQSIIETDPYQCSVILSNLGSIKLHSGYHHLTDWGTTSIFVIIGEKKPRAFTMPDGSVEMRDSVDLGLTIDERIGDGYYFSKTVRLLKKLLENPELLEQTMDTPVEY